MHTEVSNFCNLKIYDAQYFERIFAVTVVDSLMVFRQNKYSFLFETSEYKFKYWNFHLQNTIEENPTLAVIFN